MNRSNKHLSSSDESLLTYGPSFIPSTIYIDYFDLQVGFDRFCKKMRNAYLRSKRPAKEEIESKMSEISQHPFENPPYVPNPKPWAGNKTTNAPLETFLQKIANVLFSGNKLPIQHNLSRNERSSLNKFRNNSDLVLKMQDKGSSFVIMNRSEYLAKMKSSIQRSGLKNISYDPSPAILDFIKNLFLKFGTDDFPPMWQDFIVPKVAKAAYNYGLVKTHKNGEPTRLITSVSGSVIENLSIFVTKALQNSPVDRTHIIQDKFELIDKLDKLNQNGVPENAIFLSFDVLNMFPSISNYIGVKEVFNVLEKRTCKIPSTWSILHALAICLKCNISTFENEMFLQKDGTAMGPPFACDYADIAMAPFDRKILQFCQEKILFYGRYRDDTLLLFTGNESDATLLLSFLNSIDDNIKFTLDLGTNGGKSINFLDLNLSLRQGKILFDLYSKKTNCHAYLHRKSNHPPSIFKSVAYGTASRIRKGCDDMFFEKRSLEYQEYLLRRGYKQREVKKAFNFAANFSRKNFPKFQRKEFSAKYLFITKFDQKIPRIKDLIFDFLPILHSSSENLDLFPKESFAVVHKREKNLREFLAPSKLKPKPVNKRYSGMKKCGKKRCQICQLVPTTKYFHCHHTNRKFKLRGNFNCDSKFVVYALRCRKCKKHYIGSTLNFRDRTNKHKSNIRRKNIKEGCRYVNHFVNHCVSPEKEKPFENIEFIVIDQLLGSFDINNKQERARIEELLLKKEQHWIAMTLAMHKGLNATKDWSTRKRQNW